MWVRNRNSSQTHPARFSGVATCQLEVGIFHFPRLGPMLYDTDIIVCYEQTITRLHVILQAERFCIPVTLFLAAVPPNNVVNVVIWVGSFAAVRS